MLDQRVPGYIWLCVLAATCGGVGSLWDISWHKSIGRDSFWTPAHVLIYLCGVIAGLTCGYMILSTTFGRSSAAREAGVRVWGCRGPLGAFLCAWGGIAMIASAPFDDWWHNAYGLDLSLGAFQELTIRTNMHSARFYLLVALAIPLWLAAISAVSSSRWACTIVTACYSAYYISFIWILPLFPAEPKLGPVFQSVTRFVPPDFPLLLIAPAVAIDLLRRIEPAWPKWRYTVAAGCVFLAAFVAAQWPFAEFLQSPGARNWVFGTQHIPYFVPADTDYVRYLFTPLERSSSEFILGC